MKPAHCLLHRLFIFTFLLLAFFVETVCANEPEHLIISTKTFEEVAKEFIEYRDAYEDVKSKFVSIEEIKERGLIPRSKYSHKGWETDKPSKISIKGYDFKLAKQITGFLEHYAKKSVIGSVLIIGDGAVVPPSYYFFDDYDIGDPYYRQYSSWIPSDLYYGSPDLDLKYDWPVGRISVDTPAQADTYIRKVARWREDLDPKNVPPAVYFGGNVTRNFLYFGETFYDVLQDQGLLGANPLVYMESAHKFGTGLGIHVLRQVPATFMWIFSHGMGDGFVFEDFPVLAQMIEQAPYKKGLPLIMSPSCMDAGFDYDLIDVPYDVDGLSVGEAIIRSPGAGIGYLGGSRVNLTDGDVNFVAGKMKIDKPGYMPSILIEFLQSYHEGTTRLGDAFKDSYHTYYKRHGVSQPGDMATYASYILMADPTIRMPKLGKWKGPKKDTIKFVGDFELNADEIPVFPSGSESVNIFKSTGKDYTVRFVDALKKQTIVDKYPLSSKSPTKFIPPSDSLYFAAVENDKGEVSWHYFWVGKSKSISDLMS